MDDQLSDAVRDYQLSTQRGKNRRYVVHVIRDPDLPPSAPPRSESWKSSKVPIGRGGQGKVFLQTCIGGVRHYHQRAVKVIPYADDESKRRYMRELETLVRFSHEKVCIRIFIAVRTLFPG